MPESVRKTPCGPKPSAHAGARVGGTFEENCVIPTLSMAYASPVRHRRGAVASILKGLAVTHRWRGASPAPPSGERARRRARALKADEQRPSAVPPLADALARRDHPLGEAVDGRELPFVVALVQRPALEPGMGVARPRLRHERVLGEADLVAFQPRQNRIRGAHPIAQRLGGGSRLDEPASGDRPARAADRPIQQQVRLLPPDPQADALDPLSPRG